MRELLSLLLAANLAGGAAVLIVLALRRLARAHLGARLAYALWLIAPAAMLASLVPPRTVVVQAAPAAAAGSQTTRPANVTPSADEASASPTPRSLDLAQSGLAIWLAGTGFSLLRLAMGQARAMAGFGVITRDPANPRLARAASGTASPALVGLFRPRIVLPADFESRFDPAEQALILAHEQAHLAQAHPLTNGVIALLKAVNWFNPLVHIGAHFARIDQELACDAAVLAARPGARKAYGRALLKSQLNHTAMPLGCYWPGRSGSEITERIEMLRTKSPGRLRATLGAAVIAAAATSASVAVWAAQAPHVETRPAPAAPASPPAIAMAAGVDAAQPLLGAVEPVAMDDAVCLTNTCGQEGDVVAVAGPRSTPLPQSEPAIRGLISDIVRGAPNYDQMSPAAADSLRRRMKYELEPVMTFLGKIESLTFDIGEGPTDNFFVDFEHGAARFTLAVNREGAIEAINIIPEVRSAERNAAVFAANDEDGDGLLDKAAYLAAIHEIGGLGDPDTAFLRTDRDGDGVVSTAEYNAVIPARKTGSAR